jgi:hypothetical protein
MKDESIDYKQVCGECLADIEGIYVLFQDDRCTNVPLARKRMADLKAKWKERIKQGKRTDVERVVIDALNQISVKSNSTPDHQWTSSLYAARISLNFHLGH